MAKVPKKHRDATYERDNWMCLSCGDSNPSYRTFQHRQALGMGGSSFRTNNLLFSDGITACGICNNAFENTLQTEALLSGWKVARFIRDAFKVPVMEKPTATWFRLDQRIAVRTEIGQDEARHMMREAYGEHYLLGLITPQR